MSLRRWFEDNFGVGDYRPDTRTIDGVEVRLLPPSPKPRLRTVRAAPSREDFAAWREESVTQFVLAALARNAKLCEETWHETSWEGGVADQLKLVALRERADALKSMAEADYDAFCDMLGLEPEVEQENG